MSEFGESCGMVDSTLVSPDHWVPSPNFGQRAAGRCIDLLLLHYTATPTNEYALELLTSPGCEVSSHYLVDGEGVIYQMVREAQRAWHAGDAMWAGECDINSCSIGIEIQNQGAALRRLPAYGRAQMKAVIALSLDIIKRHNIRPERVLGHSDVAPIRKQDPGAHFDWQALYRAGAGLWVPAEPVQKDDVQHSSEFKASEILAVQGNLKTYGYELELTGELDDRTSGVVMAFQRHFRPERVDGKLDRSTIATLERLVGALKA